MSNYQEKNVGVLLKKGTSVREPVLDERDGTVGGYHVKHWDGRQDAVVQPKPIRVKVNVKEER
jgi:hypothetical protein